MKGTFWWILLLLLVKVNRNIVKGDDSIALTSTNVIEARGGYGGYGGGGGGYGGHGHGGGGYDGGGGYGGHGQGTISMDPVSVLGLLSLGAVLLRSILTLLTASARSLDVSDINLPLTLSDIPEAISNWQGMSPTHVVYERSLDDDEHEEDPVAPIRHYLSMLNTDTSCIPDFLCNFWKRKSDEEVTFLDVVMLTTVSWNGLSEAGALYDQMKIPDSSFQQNYCTRARSVCSTSK